MNDVLAGMFAADRPGTDPIPGTVTLPIMLELHRVPQNDAERLALRVRIENAVLQVLGNELLPGAGVIVTDMLHGVHVETRTREE